ncbi:hypothetical protein LUW76_37225 [Actinomadura madurae]|uniref:5'-methylthioadenosine/S-adenosylhomocysteine nucleosidase family protein n=1 Tax=Actinomadura madurae TaxID=1993 RepID=UPI0020264C40|nr:hypothetical protein [Actinomadura madurae]URM99510.1 hypothetical protein LUW76_37225 [Actinomadura madurae]
MNENFTVHGAMTMGGVTNVTNSALGEHPVINIGAEQSGSERKKRGADIGIITMLDVETSALRLALGLQEAPSGDLRFYTGKAGGMDITAIRTLDQGQQSTIAAYDHLRAHHDPTMIVLAGIGGGIHKDVRLGDVVVATRVVYYDLRKETPEGTRHRGQERVAPAGVGHAVNAFFTDHEPAEFTETDPADTSRTFTAHHGPIGSGDAVIADGDAEILHYLAGFNDKILAVDMEAGGFSQACHERTADTGRPHGWVVVRGISDKADAAKDDDYHRIASWHAAATVRELLPYLRTAPE